MIDGEIVEVPVTIPQGAQNSAVVQLDRGALIRIRTPNALDGTELTFQEGSGSGNMLEMRSGADALSVPVAPSQSIVVSPANFAGMTAFRIVSNASESAARTFTLVTRRV